jgi:hypothetical protein
MFKFIIIILVFIKKFWKYFSKKNFFLANNFHILDYDYQYQCFLEFVYDMKNPNKETGLTAFINKAIKALQISHSSLLDYIYNNYIYNSNFILAFEPIAV